MRKIIASTVPGLLWMHPVLAQEDLLTRAEAYKLINQAKLLPKGQNPRPAKVADILVPLDALYTAARSRADLLFNVRERWQELGQIQFSAYFNSISRKN